MLGKRTEFSDSIQSKVTIYYDLDVYFETLPISYQVKPNNYVWLGRKINWLNELFHHFRLKILAALYLTSIDWTTFDKKDLPFGTEFLKSCILSSVDCIVAMARSFIAYTNGFKDFTYIILSKCLYLGAVAHCASSDVVSMEIIHTLIEAIKLSTSLSPEDELLLLDCSNDRELARRTLLRSF